MLLLLIEIVFQELMVIGHNQFVVHVRVLRLKLRRLMTSLNHHRWMNLTKMPLICTDQPSWVSGTARTLCSKCERQRLLAPLAHCLPNF
jgi:hypothetical protein